MGLNLRAKLSPLSGYGDGQSVLYSKSVPLISSIHLAHGTNVVDLHNKDPEHMVPAKA